MSLKRIDFLFGVFVFACLIVLAPLSYAQETGTEDDPKTDVSAHPMHIGSFFVSPRLTLEQQYDDNVFAAEINEKSDFITILVPSINIGKFYRDHEFSLESKAEIVRFWDNKVENIENFKNEFSGLLTAYHNLKIPFSVKYDIDHKQRRQERTLNKTKEPTKFTSLETDIGLEYQPNRLLLGLYGNYGQRRFENGESVAGNLIVREDGDFDSMGLQILAKYNTRREWSPFMSFLVNQNDFLRRSFDGVGFNGLARDSTVYKALAGIGMNYKGLIVGDIAIGHEWRDYKDQNVEDIEAISAEASITFFPTAGSSLLLELMRDTDEDNIINRGLVETDIALTFDYELQKDLFLSAIAEWQNTDFVNDTREDDTYTMGLGLEYIINPHFQLEGEVLRRWRDSNEMGADFEQNVIIGRITGAL